MRGLSNLLLAPTVKLSVGQANYRSRHGFRQKQRIVFAGRWLAKYSKNFKAHNKYEGLRTGVTINLKYNEIKIEHID